MAKKPTYKELEQRIKELEKEALMRSHSEGAMLESQERYRKLFHHSNDGIFIHDFEGNIIDVNQDITEVQIKKIKEIKGVIRVRAIPAD